MRVALVVGASSGLGYAVARRFAEEGIRTYAAARSFLANRETPPGCEPDMIREGQEPLSSCTAVVIHSAKKPPPGCEPIAMDVCDPASVKRAADELLHKAGRIDILVNCAARLTLGAFEELSESELRAVMETNFFGAVRVIQTVLPIMRAQKSGRIIQMSSLNGLLAIPFQGAYVASKHALEGFCEALAMEVRPFGISVTIVEPGDCSGGSDAYRQKASVSESESSPYHHSYTVAVNKIQSDESGGQSPERVAAAVVRVVSKKRPPLRVQVARMDQRLAVSLHDLLPGRLFQRIIVSHYVPHTYGNRSE